MRFSMSLSATLSVDPAGRIPVEEVGEEDLADFHVDARDDRPDLGLHIARQEAGVRVRIKKAVSVEIGALVGAELVEAGFLVVEELLNRLMLAQVVFDADLDHQTIEIFEFHRGHSFGEFKKTNGPMIIIFLIPFQTTPLNAGWEG
jgi:hypothetical protein